jgi:hypothetical protein
VCYNIIMSRKIEAPIVPIQLNHLLDERVLEVHERFASMSYEKLLRDTVLTEIGSTDRDHERYGSIMFGRDGADAEAGVLILASSYLQAWKPSKTISALFTHDVVNPDGITIVLPNNSGDKRYYEFTDEEIAKMNNRDLMPFYEKRLSSVEDILGNRALGEVAFGGFSQGALVALGMAAVGSDLFSVERVNAFEPPSEERTPKKLKSDFTKSSHPFEQRRAINDARIPALSESLNRRRLAKDYIRFGLDSTTPESKAVMNGMASPKVNDLARQAINRNDGVNITLGFVEGSKMLGNFKLDRGLTVSGFGIGKGPGSHRHATSDNIVANALMMQANR